MFATAPAEAEAFELKLGIFGRVICVHCYPFVPNRRRNVALNIGGFFSKMMHS